MNVLYDDALYVNYSFFYLDTRGGPSLPEPPETLLGQANGLCGGAVPGVLFLVTGLESGFVELRIELLDEAPGAGVDAWQDVVEVSFNPAGLPALLLGAADRSELLGLSVSQYRVRYSAWGMDEAHGVSPEGVQEVDRYLLQLWPAPSAPDVVITEHSETAKYWHGVARTGWGS